MTISIVIADDHPLYREGVARVLDAAEGFRVVAEAEDAASAIAAAAEHRPDLMLLDISMPGGGISALRDIVAAGHARQIAMLTVSEEDDDIMRALKLGAQGYVLKGIGARDLIRVVRDLAAGRSYVSPSLAARMIQVMQETREREDAFSQLTRREEEILQLVAEGNSNKEVANALNLQEKTIKHNMTSILQKLQARNRTEAALMARDHWRT